MTAFYCDPVFSAVYDELMRVVDPSVDHAGWLQRALDGRTPSRIVDVGAGTGRVARSVVNLYPDAKLVVVEPDAQMFPVLIAKFPLALNTTLHEFATSHAEPADLAYVTYGSLQYAETRAHIVVALGEMYQILAPSGIAAIEFFPAESLAAMREDLAIPVSLQGEMWELHMEVRNEEGGRCTVTSTVVRVRDGVKGVMRETLVPLTVQECETSLLAAGFTGVQFQSGSSYHRFVAHR